MLAPIKSTNPQSTNSSEDPAGMRMSLESQRTVNSVDSGNPALSTITPGNTFRRVASAAAVWLRRPDAAEVPKLPQDSVAGLLASGIPITNWDDMGYRDFGHWRKSILSRIFTTHVSSC